MQKLKWDFDGFSVLASAKFDSKLIFKRKKIITCNDKGSAVDVHFLSMLDRETYVPFTCRFAYFRYIPRKVLFKSECVMGIGPILLEIVLDFRKYLF
jgi:hypothetical protein